jgi:hypothetical protein
MQAASNGERIDVSNAIIRGTLDLKYAILEEEVRLINCQLRGSTDCSYVTFKRNVVLSGTTFEQGVVLHSATLEFDAQLDDVKIPAGEADFTDLHVKGVFVADRIRLGKGVEPNFNRAHFDKTAFFLDSVFEGGASFRAARFGDQAAFQGAAFNGDTHFNGAWVGQHALFRAEPKLAISGASFAGPVYFDGSYIGDQANFQGVVFKSNASFYEVKIQSGALFYGKPEEGIPPTVFEGDVDFRGADIRGDADFTAIFKGKAELGMHVGGKADFRDCVFEKAVNFRTHIVGKADFRGTVFEETANFDLARLEGGATFSAETEKHHPEKSRSSATFKGRATFQSARFLGQADFRATVFKQEVTFNLARMEAGAFFRGEPDQNLAAANFEGEADFTLTHFEGAADFQGVAFKEKVGFSGAKITGDASFNGDPDRQIPAAEFSGDANFSATQFCREARFSGARFKQNVIFDGASVGEAALFWQTNFGMDASFVGVDFRGQSDFQHAVFERKTTFSVAKFGGDVFFGDAVLKAGGEADFRGSRFRSVADFQNSIFECESDFYAARCDSLVRFRGTTFQNRLALSETSFQAVDFINCKFKGSVDLLGCTYERIQVDWPLLMSQAEGELLDSGDYDRQPYTQLEKILRAAGQTHEADKVYLRRQHAERKVKWQRREYGEWLFSLLYWRLVNYGVRPIRLIFFSLLLLVLGTIVFQSPNAVSPKEQKVVVERPNPWLTLDAIGVALHQFLPMEVPIGSKWVPSENRVFMRIPWSDRVLPFGIHPPTFATFFLRIPGWILLPLGAGAIAGLLRGKP